MNSEMFTLKVKDVVKGAITAVFASVFMTISGLFQQVGFDVFSADWKAILTMVINVALATFVAYIAKNFFTNDKDKLFGKI